VLEANKRDASAINDEFTSIRSPDADHENDVDVNVILEESAALLCCSSRERDDISSFQHRTQIRTICKRCKLYYVPKMGTVGVQDVVMPVGLEEAAMRFEVAEVGSDAISAIEYCKKIR
jgi:hypothetical protein